MKKTRRLFYALWPDRETARRLHALQSSVQGRRTHVDDLHLTLAFLGQQPADRLESFQDLLQDLSVPRLPLCIDRLGHFPKARIAWAGMARPPSDLHALQQALVQRLAQSGTALPDSGPFRPHITLARGAPSPGAFEGDPFIWHADTIALAESHSGAPPRYRIVSSRTGAAS